METYQVYLTPEPKSGLEGMFATSNKKDDDDEFIKMKPASRPAELIKQQLELHPALNLLPYDQRKQLEKLVKRVESYQNTRVLLLGPDISVPGL